jgi:hypothetical protein
MNQRETEKKNSLVSRSFRKALTTTRDVKRILSVASYLAVLWRLQHWCTLQIVRLICYRLYSFSAFVNAKTPVLSIPYPRKDLYRIHAGIFHAGLGVIRLVYTKWSCNVYYKILFRVLSYKVPVDLFQGMQGHTLPGLKNWGEGFRISRFVKVPSTTMCLLVYRSRRKWLAVEDCWWKAGVLLHPSLSVSSSHSLCCGETATTTKKLQQHGWEVTPEEEDCHRRDMKDYWAEEEAHSHMLIKPRRDGVVPSTTPASSSEAHHELQRTEEEKRRGQDG